ncbi:ADP-ribosyl cyclase/cyclic ADP-ribose hydrolase 1-like isoform 2-T2 [Menidia menidia]
MGAKTYLAISGAVIVFLTIIVVPPAVLLSPRSAHFRATFRTKCLAFPQTSLRCEQILGRFEEAYVGQNSCNFPEKRYDQLFIENPFTHSCNKTMFWSDTNDLVHKFTERRDHFITLEDTLLGFIMDGLTWCGKKGSKETFIYQCEKCPVNTFADYACGDATVMLNGRIHKPFDPTSYFGAIEVKGLRYPRVKSLTVILVTKNDNVDCSQESLQVLQNMLDPNIVYRCLAATEAHIQDCLKNGITNEACWSWM